MIGIFEGRTALVTGSSSGIGAAIARRLAADGARVAVTGRNAGRAQAVADGIRQAGGTAIVTIGDLATAEGADTVARQAIAELGGIDILVNNAGGQPDDAGHTPWMDVTDDRWVEAFQMNVLSAVRMARLVVPGMQAKGWGRIVQIGSGVTHSPMAIIPEYQAAKAGLANLTATLAKTVARTGITVNQIDPGFIVTPPAEAWLRNIAREKGWADDWAEIERRAAAEMMDCLVARVGRVEDIANAVAFLAGSQADFISGAVLRVDGGASV